MRQPPTPPTPEQLRMLRWTASLGAIGAHPLAFRLGVSVASARARLNVAERRGWLRRSRPLAGWPALYTITGAGLRVADLANVTPGRVSASSAMHFLTCAAVAAALERSYPGHRVLGERELRGCANERERLLASAPIGNGSGRDGPRHRCDLLLLARAPLEEPALAVEVELTVKAPARLLAICRAWARSRHLAGVLYVAPPNVARAVERARRAVGAEQRVAIVELAALPWPK